MADNTGLRWDPDPAVRAHALLGEVAGDDWWQDELGELSAASLRGMDVGADLTRLEQKLRMYLQTHEDRHGLSECAGRPGPMLQP